MMIEHDHIAALLLEPLDAFNRSGTAIHSQHHLSAMFLKAIFDCNPAQSVAFFEPMREIAFDFAAECAQNLDENCCGANAIDVIVAEDNNWLPVLPRLKQALHRSIHSRDEEWIGQIFQTRVKKAADRAGVVQAAIEQALREQRRNIEILR